MARLWRFERPLRRVLDNWKFWIGVAYFGLALLVVLLFVSFNRQADDRAARLSIEQANRVAQVNTCLNRVTTSPEVQDVTRTILMLVDDRLGELRNSPRTTPTKLRQFQRARDEVRDFLALNAASTPTRRECVRLARQLGVNVP